MFKGKNIFVIISMIMNERISKIVENFNHSKFFRGSVTLNEAMSEHTTMKVGGPAQVFVCPEDEMSAAYAFFTARKEGIKTFTLGGGSNLVVNDDGIEGIVICTCRNNKITMEKDVLNADKVNVVCSAGVQNNDTVEFCAHNGLSGMESFAGLPGTAGGAAYMNARCYEVNISDRLSYVEYLELDELYAYADKSEALSDEELEKVFLQSLKKITIINPEEWDYKKSPFMGRERYITKVAFSLTALDKGIFTEGYQVPQTVQSTIRDKNAYYVEERRKRGHFEAPSAGSVFKNNRSFGKPSGALVDQAGLKGMQVGGAQVAPWHGNFIINKSNASAKDIKDLVQLVQEKVKAQTGFSLECEIIFV